jgi:hypothetical protein
MFSVLEMAVRRPRDRLGESTLIRFYDDEGASHVIAVGPCPNVHVQKWTYLGGTALKLSRLCGQRVTWYNLFGEEPLDWNRAEAKHVARSWCLDERNDPLTKRTLLLLGRKVQDAFGLFSPRPLEIVTSSPLWPRLVAVPHPSGLNRWYNHEDNTAQAQRLLSALARGEE